MLVNFARFLSSVEVLLKTNIFNNIIQKKLSVSNSVDPGQAQHFIGPDLGPNYLRRLSGDDKSRNMVWYLIVSIPNLCTLTLERFCMVS